MPPTPKPKFADGEKLLCYHGLLLYEAKCVRSKKEPGGAGGGTQYTYLVHYLGWNKNWDEWVGESRVLKINPENMEKKAKLLSSHMATVSKEGGSSKKKQQAAKLAAAAASTTSPSILSSPSLSSLPAGSNLAAAATSNNSPPPQSSSTPPSLPSSSTSSSASSTYSVSAAKDGGGSGTTTPLPGSAMTTTTAAATAVSGTSSPVLAKGGGSGRGSDSGNTSRASTPVSEKSFKTGAGGTKRPHEDELSDSTPQQPAMTMGGGAKRPRLSTTSSSGGGTTSMGSKRRQSSTTTTATSTEFNIVIPEELKYVLVSDWDLITHKKYLFSLPAKTPVATILSDYLRQYRGNRGKQSGSTVMAAAIGVASEVVKGVLDYFDAYIGSHLLYKLERQQYEREVLGVRNRLRPSDVYGSAHLLRMMVKMGSLLDKAMLWSPPHGHSLSSLLTNDTSEDDASETGGRTVGEDGSLKVISDVIHDLLGYLEDNRTSYFTSKNYVESAAAV